MEKVSTKALKSSKCFPSERFRSFLYFMAILCLLSSIVYLFVAFVSMKKQLDDVKRELSAISSKESETHLGEKTLSRHKRTTNTQVNLSDLDKRIIALESRTVKLSNDMQMKTSLRGRDGRDGMQGAPGSAGRDGRDGRQGPAGPPGFTGPKGDVGPTGVSGPAGRRGPQGEKGSQGQALSGVTYNRWGRTSCYGDASVVYTGVMGSGHHNGHGGGSNFLCLPNNPVYDKYVSGWQATAGIYGTEYESSYFPGFNHLHNHDAPCAVCYVRLRGSQLMVPATNKCPSGWTREYRGYLMTSHYGHKHASEFVCIDADAEVVQGSHRDTDGALLYFVQSSCSHGLPCKPYIAGQELTCVVCTK